MAAYRMLRDHIRYFHIKDALYEGAIVPPGCGNAKIGEILAEHKVFADKDFFISLEPHLQLFSGLNALVGRSFENPYKYESAELAFADAHKKLLELILCAKVKASSLSPIMSICFKLRLFTLMNLKTHTTRALSIMAKIMPNKLNRNSMILEKSG